MNLKVMTFNLLYAEAVNPAGAWSARLPLAIDVLSEGADIIGLQEATARQIADIERELPEYTVVTGPESGDTRIPRLIYHAARLVRRVAPSRSSSIRDYEDASDDGTSAVRTSRLLPHGNQYRGEHCAILFRTARFHAVEGNAFWLSHRPHHPGSVLPGTWLPRVVNWVRLREQISEHCVTVYNAHIDFMPWAPVRSARILRQVLDAHWDGSLQLLIGDFNAARYSASFRHLSRQLKENLLPPLADAWLEAAERKGPEGTYHAGTGRVRWPGRLDRILFRPSLLVERASTVTHHCGRVYPSDHYPVVAELRMA